VFVKLFTISKNPAEVAGLVGVVCGVSGLGLLELCLIFLGEVGVEWFGFEEFEDLGVNVFELGLVVDVLGCVDYPFRNFGHVFGNQSTSGDGWGADADAWGFEWWVWVERDCVAVADDANLIEGLGECSTVDSKGVHGVDDK